MSETQIEYGVDRQGLKFFVKVSVVVVRSTSLGEVVGRVSSEILGEDRASMTSLESSLWSTGSSCSMLLTTQAWTFPFSRCVDLQILICFLLKPATMSVHISFGSRFLIALS